MGFGDFHLDEPGPVRACWSLLAGAGAGLATGPDSRPQPADQLQRRHRDARRRRAHRRLRRAHTTSAYWRIKSAVDPGSCGQRFRLPGAMSYTPGPGRDRPRTWWPSTRRAGKNSARSSLFDVFPKENAHIKRCSAALRADRENTFTSVNDEDIAMSPESGRMQTRPI